VNVSENGRRDTFARDNLPPPELQPEFLLDLPALRYPARLNCAVELLDGMVARGFGPRPAILTPLRRLTYAQLLAESNRIAAVLRDELGLVSGNRVLIRGHNDATTAACWLGVLKAGGIAVTTMPLLRSKELGDAIGQAQIAFALCDARLAADLHAAAAGLPVLRSLTVWGDGAPDALETRMRRHPATFANVETAADDVALIAFTSGTTGKPKGTLHYHRDVLAICDTFAAQHVGARPEDVFCGTPPLGFTFGLGGLLLFPLRAGASTLLLEAAPPETLLAAMAEYGASICFAAPTAYRAMTPHAARFDLRALRVCVSAGEALPVATRAAWLAATGLAIVDGIGATEMLHIFIAASGDGIRPGATGKPVAGYVAAILGEDGRELGPGEVGRLAVRGPTGCRYLAGDRQREYVRDGWNVTGDAYLRDADGYYWYQARTDDMIVSAGYNIAGPEVEAALLAHPGVAECAVVGEADEARGCIVKAFVVLRPGVAAEPATVRALQDWTKARIAPYKYPRAIEFVDALPRTETGKLQRFKLRDANERPA
jgi:2-aminobenzoate-CoA ligase